MIHDSENSPVATTNSNDDSHSRNSSSSSNSNSNTDSHKIDDIDDNTTIKSTASSTAVMEEGCTSSSSSSSSSSSLSSSNKKADDAELEEFIEVEKIHCDPVILYRYPPEVDIPSPEITDFCMPLPCSLQHLSAQDAWEEVIYFNLSRRSERSFVFILDEKGGGFDTDDVEADEEAGVNTGRLYGICVVHPRLLTSAGADFESSVCFTILTRFPFFDFFFQILYDMLAVERLGKMEQLSELYLALNKSVKDQYNGSSIRNDTNNANNANDIDDTNDTNKNSNTPESPSALKKRLDFPYIPTTIFGDVLSRLSHTAVPLFGGSVSFQVAPSLSSRTHIRSPPPLDTSESRRSASEWSVPVLLTWLSPDVLVWTLGLLLCETKVLVLADSPGLASTAVLGLLALLRPVKWVAPCIPLLPNKHIDFIESPVPILAGVVPVEVSHNNDANTMSNSSHHSSTYHKSYHNKDYKSRVVDESRIRAMKILQKCDPEQDYDVNSDTSGLTAVLDITQRELYIQAHHESTLASLIMPGANALRDKIQEVWEELPRALVVDHEISGSCNEVDSDITSQSPFTNKNKNNSSGGINSSSNSNNNSNSGSSRSSYVVNKFGLNKSNGANSLTRDDHNDYNDNNNNNNTSRNASGSQDDDNKTATTNNYNNGGEYNFDFDVYECTDIQREVANKIA